MASACIANCITDARLPVRATYVNLYKWPESDHEFVNTVSSNWRQGCGGGGQARVVDSVSCRQLYLRSYTFSRKETVFEKTRKCLGRVRDRVAIHRRKKKSPRRHGSGRKKRAGFRRAKEVSCAALFSIFRRLLSCTGSTAKVDVVG